MNEHTHEDRRLDDETPASMDGAGFEAEGEDASAGQNAVRPPPRSDELRRNFRSVFGHGIGRFALIAAGVVIVLTAALGYRGLSGKKELAPAAAAIDVPTTPTPEVSVSPISEQEARRRAERAALEAEQAAQRGQTYQPGFDPIVANRSPPNPTPPAQFHVPGVAPPSDAAAAGRAPVTVSAGQGGATPAQEQAQSAALQAEQKARLERQEQEYQRLSQERDRYVSEIRSGVLKNIDELFGEPGKGGASAPGAYSTTSYYPLSASEDRTGPPGQQEPPAGGRPEPSAPVGAPEESRALGNPNGRLLIKTGAVMYATLDAEVNTDDGGDVMATVRGGSWNGAKLIGRIEQSPQNIRLMFNVMAPQDNRPTMRINAVAIREDDAKQGMADIIDHHALSRYTALAAAAILSGLGQAAQINPGTTILYPSGGVTSTTDSVSNARIAGMALGQVGVTLGQEVQRGFNRPTTYATPAQRGFGVYFLQDVYEQR